MPADSPSGDKRRARRIALFVGLLAGACLWLSFQFIEPIPPRQIVLASGPESSLYHQHAGRYKELMAQHGVTVVERMTEGAGDNLRLLGDPSSGVDIGFVQGGQAGSPEAKGVVMRASHQPLWIFVRRGERIDSLAALADKTVGMGMPGSGTNALAASLLAANGVTESDAKLVHIPTHRSRLAVQTGEVDVALMVGGVRTVIKGNWKLVKIALLPGKTELFDLSVDPGEKNDIAAQNPEVVRDLDARLVAYAKQQKMSEWLKAQPDYLGAQGKTVFDPDFDIDDGGLPQMKTVLPKK